MINPSTQNYFYNSTNMFNIPGPQKLMSSGSSFQTRNNWSSFQKFDIGDKVPNNPFNGTNNPLTYTNLDQSSVQENEKPKDIINFDKEELEFIQNVLTLQEKLTNINNTLEISVLQSYLLNSVFFQNEKYHQILANNMIDAVAHNISNEDSYFSLMEFISSKCIKFKELFLKSFFITYDSTNHFLDRIYFLRFCFSKEFFSESQIINSIQHFLKRKGGNDFSISILFIWFCPEIEKRDKILFNRLDAICQQTASKKDVDNLIKFFVRCELMFHENNWEQLRNLYLKKKDDTVIRIVKNDDIKPFVYLFCKKKILNETKLKAHFFYHSIYQRPNSLICFATLYSAQQILSFLLENQVKYENYLVDLFEYAMIANNTKMVQILVPKAKKEFTELAIMAIRYHSFDVFLYIFITFFFSLSLNSHEYSKLLNSCIIHNNLKIFKFLIENNIYPNYSCVNLDPALHATIKSGNYPMFQILLKTKNIDFNILDSNHRTPFDLCLKMRQYRFVEDMLEIPEVTKDSKSLDGPLLAMVNHPKFISLLIQNKANVNCVDNKGFSALHLAAKINQLETLKILLNVPEINLTLMSKSQETAVSIAIENGNLDILKLFVEKNENIITENIVLIFFFALLILAKFFFYVI